MKIGVIGNGRVGSALAAGLERIGHQVRFGHRDPEEPVKDAAEWGELIIMAVPFVELRNAARSVGAAADGKIVVDVTNPLNRDGEWGIGYTTSAAEELQRALPNAKVVKCFNTVFAQNQSIGMVGDVSLTAFVAGNDKGSREAVMDLAREMGYEPVDAGPLHSARYLEPMGMQLISLAFIQGMGPYIGYRLVIGNRR